MILTCPQCDTKYVVKDGAIPAGGRQVRCASCKHSWHQDADNDGVAAGGEAPNPATTGLGGPPMPDPDHSASGHPGEVPAEAADEQGVGIAPPEADLAAEADATPRPPELDGTYGLTAPSLASTHSAAPPVENLTDDYASVPLSQTLVDDDVAADDDFLMQGFDEDEGGQSGRLFKTILVILVLVAIAVAAFWFLAPAELRSRVGLTAADRSPLKIMLDTRDRQPLQSGNELLAISGRIQNPTDEEQPVPAIRAELRNRQTQKLIHSWTIRPQARILPPNGVTRFNSAEIDVPKGGDDLSLSLGAE